MQDCCSLKRLSHCFLSLYFFYNLAFPPSRPGVWSPFFNGSWPSRQVTPCHLQSSVTKANPRPLLFSCSACYWKSVSVLEASPGNPWIDSFEGESKLSGSRPYRCLRRAGAMQHRFHRQGSRGQEAKWPRDEVAASYREKPREHLLKTPYGLPHAERAADEGSHRDPSSSSRRCGSCFRRSTTSFT